MSFGRFFFLLSLFLLVSCGDKNSTNFTAAATTVETDAYADLYVYVIDAVSGAPIPGAGFQLPLLDSAVRKTDGVSGVTFQNLPVGENYAVSVSAQGYASASCNASIRFAGNVSNTNIAIAENVTRAVPLHKRAASLRGSLFYRNLENPFRLDVRPAQGATVSVLVQDANDCVFQQKSFGPVTVNADGFFSFDSLPEQALYSLVAHDATLNKVLYSGKQITGSLNGENNTTVLPQLVYDRVQTAFGFVFTSDNRAVAEKNDSLVFKFSEPVNSSLLRYGNISVSKAGDGSLIATGFTWKDSGKTLTIFPVLGEWESSSAYSVSLKLYSALSSEAIDTTLVFTVNEFSDFSGRPVSGVVLVSDVNYNAASVPLRWNSLENAEAYEIYAKVSSRFEVNYRLAGETSSVTNGVLDTVFTLPAPNWFSKGDSVQILIVARNGKGKSAFGSPLTVQDRVKPQITAAPAAIAPDTANFVINATNNFNKTGAESSITQNVTFNEPMDTTAALLTDFPESLPRVLSVETAWTSETVLKITVKVSAGELNTSIERLAIPLTVRGLRDNAKNPVRATTVRNKTWEDLLILLRVDAVP
ncbi:MAG: hypothetical protein LBR60_02705 [Fibrobacter sp.]|jgi:hypothetical protein|nr:hypothetical protein [Fibrobacter sp.]